MITSHVHTISSHSTAFTVSGLDVFESGPTNFTISFSSCDVNGTYCSFYVKYPNEDDIYTITSPGDDLDSIRTQSISKTFYPDHDNYTTTYTIDVSGLKNDLSIDQYRINLQIGRDVMTKYKGIKLVGSQLYTNKEGSNYCLLTLEHEHPHFLSNVIVPYNKSAKVYITQPPLPFIPNDDMVLRTEQLSKYGAEIPICIEVQYIEVIKEQQWEIVAVATENNFHSETGNIIEHNIGNLKSREWGNSGLTMGSVSRGAGEHGAGANGDYANDHIINIPEDGIDYSIDQEEAGGGYFANDAAINITITDIYPGGVAT